MDDREKTREQLLAELKEARASLRACQEKRQAALDDRDRVFDADTRQAIFVADFECIPLYANPKAAEITGRSREDLLRCNVKDLLHPEDVDGVADACRSAADGETFFSTGPVRVLDARGGVHHMEGRYFSTLWGERPAVLCFLMDLTDRHVAQEALRESEEKYRLLVENANEAIAVIQGMRVRFANARASEFTGYPQYEPLAMDLSSIIHPDDLEMVGESHRKRLAGEEVPAAYEFRFIRKAGDVRWARVSAVLVQWEGEPAALTFFTDVTERKQMEEKLREREATLQAVFRSAPVGIGLVRNRVFHWANETFCEMLGYTCEELAGQSARVVYESDEEYERVGREKYGQISDHGTGTVETRFQRKDGAIIDVSLSSTPLDPDDLSQGVTFTALDITERKRTEHALRESEARFRAFFENSPVGMAILDATDPVRYIAVNETLARFNGLPLAEHLGKSYADIVPDTEVVRSIDDAMRSLIETRVPLRQESGGVGRDGRYVSFVADYFAISGADGTVQSIGCFVRDVSESRRAQAAMRESEGRFRAFFDNMPISLLIWNTEDPVQYVAANRVLAELNGLSQEDHVGKTIAEIMSDPAVVAENNRIARQVIETKEPVVVETGGVQESGARFWYTGHYFPVLDAQGEVVGVGAALVHTTDSMLREQALRESEDRLRTLIDAMPDIVCFKDAEGKWLVANEFDMKLFDLEGVDYRGRKDTELAEFSPFYLDALRRCEETDETAWAVGEANRGEEVIPRPDGTQRVFDVIKVPTYHEDGSRKGLVVVGRDITALKQTGDALRLEQELGIALSKAAGLNDALAATMDAALSMPGPDSAVIYLADPSTGVLQPAAARGLTEEFIAAAMRYQEGRDITTTLQRGAPVFWKTDPKGFAPGDARLREGLRGIGILPVTYRGEVIGSMNVSSHRHDTFPETTRKFLVSVASHIGEVIVRLRAEDRQRESEERYRALVENNADVIMRFDREGRHLFISQAFERYADIPRSSFLGKTHSELGFPEESCRLWEEGLAHVFRTCEPYESEFRWESKRGSYVFNWRVYPERDEQGEVVTALTIARDITEARRTQENYRMLFDNASEAIFVHDMEEGYFLDVNRVACERLGYTKEEFLGMTPASIDSPENAEQVPKRMEEVKQQGTALFESVHVARDGTRIPVEISLRVIDYLGKPSALSIARDISERKAVEEERSRLITAIEQASETIIVFDLEGRIQYINPSYERISGYARDEILGQHISFLRCPGIADAEYESICSAVATGGTWEGRITRCRKDGSEYQVISAFTPVRDPDGNVRDYVLVERDVTHETELEKRLRQAQKMEAIGTLAGGIAHDFNNILSAIVGYNELAMLATSEQSQAYRMLQQVEKASHRATDLVGQILTFSRQTEQQRKPTRIQLILKEALKLLRASLPSTIDIRRDVDERCRAVLADATQIHQVIMNLCTNAYQAMQERGGVLTVSLAEIELADPPDPDLAPGTYVRLTVSDTGYGIAPSIVGRIFDPYFTTKEIGEGTGLGLATVHGIVKSHDGAITVASTHGEGAAFEVLFPLWAGEADRAAEDAGASLPARGQGRLLVVDDEEAIADMWRIGLEDYGYAVTTCATGTDALRLIRREPMAFDLIVCDQTMPGMTGVDLAAEILLIRQDLPFILCTGFAERVDVTRLERLHVREFLTKPLSLRDLARAVERALVEEGGDTAQ